MRWLFIKPVKIVPEMTIYVPGVTLNLRQTFIPYCSCCY